MYLNHTAIYTNDLERLKSFYEKYFSACSNQQYHNPKTGLRTCFLSFDGEARLEIMCKPGVNERGETASGYTHIAFCVGGKKDVLELTNRLTGDGYALVSAPRMTGDGYYESCVRDPDGNEIELIAAKMFL